MARILIADDDGALRGLIRRTLEGAGHSVVEAGDGAEALQVCRREPIDLLLCDLFMPRREGIETIRQLRQEHPGVKVVAMSGGGSRGTTDLLPVAGRLGAVKLLRKPFGGPALLAAVDEALQAPAGVPAP
jgi:CheY-like chemotaxis protein